MNNSSLLHPQANGKGGQGASPENPLSLMTLKLGIWQPFRKWRAARFPKKVLALVQHALS
eukprot:2394102-Pyramimonas_sp.AAC.1